MMCPLSLSCPPRRWPAAGCAPSAAGIPAGGRASPRAAGGCRTPPRPYPPGSWRSGQARARSMSAPRLAARPCSWPPRGEPSPRSIARRRGCAGSRKGWRAPDSLAETIAADALALERPPSVSTPCSSTLPHGHGNLPPPSGGTVERLDSRRHRRPRRRPGLAPYRRRGPRRAWRPARLQRLLASNRRKARPQIRAFLAAHPDLALEPVEPGRGGRPRRPRCAGKAGSASCPASPCQRPRRFPSSRVRAPRRLTSRAGRAV